MKHFELEISRLIDNDLPLMEQRTLFTHLADCDDCAGLYNEMNEVKKEVKTYFGEMEAGFAPERKTITQKVNHLRTWYMTAAILILMCGLALTLNTVIKLKSQNNSLQAVINSLKQKETIPTSPSGHSEAVNNLASNRQVRQKRQPGVRQYQKVKVNKPAIDKIKAVTAPMVKLEITSEDFIGTRMVGN